MDAKTPKTDAAPKAAETFRRGGIDPSLGKKPVEQNAGRRSEKDAGSPDGKKAQNMKKNLARAKTGAKLAEGAAKTGIRAAAFQALADALMFLKSGAAAAMTMIGNALRAAGSFFAGVWSGITSAGAAAAGFFGAAGSSAAVCAASVLIIAVPMAGAFGIGMGLLSEWEFLNSSGAVLKDDCTAAVKAASAAQDALAESSADARALQMANILIAFGGMDGLHAAGVVGNFTAESGCDPSSIEGIYSEKGQIGPEKQAALADLDAYTSGGLFSMYASSGISINQSAYQASDGKYYCGIGLAQMTGNNAYKMITAAKACGMNWYDLGFQTVYMLSGGSPTGRENFWQDYNSTSFASASDAALYFSYYYEGQYSYGMEARQTAAEGIYSSVKDTSKASAVSAVASLGIDQLFSKLAVSVTQAVLTAANDAKCTLKSDSSSGGNDSIAKAMASFSWVSRSYACAEGFNGTALYQAVADRKGCNNPYPSCDHGVCAAVSWAGADDDFPSGNVLTQYSYMASSPKWTCIGRLDDVIDELEPGDVLNNNETHTMMYVGNEVLAEVFGEARLQAQFGAGWQEVNVCQASYEEHSPSISPSPVSVYPGTGTNYYVFRCTDPDNSETYSDISASAYANDISG